MLVKARFFMALGLLLLLHLTPSLAKAAPLQTLDSLLNDIQILAYDLDEAQIRQLEQQRILNNYWQNITKQDNLGSKSTSTGYFDQDQSKRHIFSNWFMQHQRRSVTEESDKYKNS